MVVWWWLDKHDCEASTWTHHSTECIWTFHRVLGQDFGELFLVLSAHSGVSELLAMGVCVLLGMFVSVFGTSSFGSACSPAHPNLNSGSFCACVYRFFVFGTCSAKHIFFTSSWWIDWAQLDMFGEYWFLFWMRTSSCEWFNASFCMWIVVLRSFVELMCGCFLSWSFSIFNILQCCIIICRGAHHFLVWFSRKHLELLLGTHTLHGTLTL